MSLSGSNTRSDTAGSPLRLVNKWESPSRSSTDTAGLSAGAAILQKTDLPQGPEPSHLWPLHGKVPSSSPQGVQFSSMTESPNPEHSRPLPTTATWHSLCLCPPLDVHRTSSLSPFMLQTKCLPLHCSLWASCTQQSFLSAPCFICCITFSTGLPRWLSGKESTCQRRRHRFSPWVGKIPREENSNSLQYSCLENSKKRGPGQVTVHGITKRHDWVMRATFSISEYGFFFFFFFWLPWLSWKLPEGRDLLCPVSTAFLRPRKVPDSKPSLNQELRNETVKLGLDTGLSDAKTEHWTHPLHFFPQLFLPSLLVWWCTEQITPLCWKPIRCLQTALRPHFFVFSAMPHPAQLYLI